MKKIREDNRMSNLDDKQLEINVMGRDYKEMCLRDRYRLEALWMLLIIEFEVI